MPLVSLSLVIERLVFDLSDLVEINKMVAILAVYIFAVEVITMQTTPRKFLVLHHTNGKLQFKTACLGPGQCHRGEHCYSIHRAIDR